MSGQFSVLIIINVTTEHTLHSRVKLSITQNRLLFFLKLQNHSLNDCINPQWKFEENPRTEYFSILLQIYISIISYRLNNGFHRITLN